MNNREAGEVPEPSSSYASLAAAAPSAPARRGVVGRGRGRSYIDEGPRGGRGRFRGGGRGRLNSPMRGGRSFRGRGRGGRGPRNFGRFSDDRSHFDDSRHLNEGPPPFNEDNRYAANRFDDGGMKRILSPEMAPGNKRVRDSLSFGSEGEILDDLPQQVPSRTEPPFRQESGQSFKGRGEHSARGRGGPPFDRRNSNFEANKQPSRAMGRMGRISPGGRGPRGGGNRSFGSNREHVEPDSVNSSSYREMGSSPPETRRPPREGYSEGPTGRQSPPGRFSTEERLPNRQFDPPNNEYSRLGDAPLILSNTSRNQIPGRELVAGRGREPRGGGRRGGRGRGEMRGRGRGEGISRGGRLGRGESHFNHRGGRGNDMIGRGGRDTYIRGGGRGSEWDGRGTESYPRPIDDELSQISRESSVLHHEHTGRAGRDNGGFRGGRNYGGPRGRGQREDTFRGGLRESQFGRGRSGPPDDRYQGDTAFRGPSRVSAEGGRLSRTGERGRGRGRRGGRDFQGPRFPSGRGGLPSTGHNRLSMPSESPRGKATEQWEAPSSSYGSLGTTPTTTVLPKPPPSPPKTPTPPPSPPPEPGKPSGYMLALARLAEMEAEMEYEFAKHVVLTTKQQQLEAQTALLIDLPVGLDALRSDLELLNETSEAGELREGT